jgi:DNA-binding GntR family transcriptional regulator
MPDTVRPPAPAAEVVPFPGPAAEAPRAPLHDTVVTQLRDLIVEGELPPGSRVQERELCARFAVSRTPLREALKVLASEGLIELLPNRGARVAQLTAQDVRDMFQVMGALEALAGQLACERITEIALAEITALHYQMLVHVKRGELRDYFRLNQAIHEAILEAARNPVLKTTYQSLAGRIRRARYMANMSEARWQEAVGEHDAILRALTARDGATLARLLTDHLANKSAVVRAAVMDGTVATTTQASGD